MFKGIAQVRAFDPVSRDGSAERRLMQLLVLFTKKLLNLDGRARRVVQYRFGHRWCRAECSFEIG
jgi:hypothetical protein